MTAIRLAHVGPTQALIKGLSGHAPGNEPALLVSYVYLQAFLNHRHRYTYRDVVLDSGAFSAHNSGSVIDLQKFADTAKRLLADPALRCTEVFSLDVIGDWRGGLRNTETLWAQDVPAIPCFHIGEPWDLLLGLARDYPKIALGGMGGYDRRAKASFIDQCFARVWPKRIHGFGMTSPPTLMRFPFHSVDASNWEVGACKFGGWKSFGRLSIRGGQQNLRAEVEWHLKLEREVRSKWAREMAQLETAA